MFTKPQSLTIAAAAAFLATSALLASPAVAQSSSSGTPTCFGHPATIVGTDGPDFLLGTPGDDVIVALGGFDIVIGLEGNDRICGGVGEDRLVGGPGNDVLYGQGGEDSLNGEAGNDVLHGGFGADYITGGDGNDNILAGNGNDYVLAGNGDDRIDGGIHHDTIFGGDGNDEILGFAGHDQLFGGSGDDHIMGHFGRDYIKGETGNDYVNSGSLDDVIDPGLGNDTIIGNTGNDTCENIGTADTVRNCENRSQADYPDLIHPCEFDIDSCLFHTGTSGQVAYVFGDSHAGSTREVFEAWARENNVTLYFQVTSGCGWNQGVTVFKFRQPEREHCLDMQFNVRPAMIENIDPDILLTTSRNYNDEFTDRTVSNPDGTPSNRPDEAHAADSFAYYRSVSDELIIVETIPAVDGSHPDVPNFNPVDCINSGAPLSSCSFEPVDYEQNVLAREAALEFDDITTVSWTHVVCLPTNCPASQFGVPIRRDRQHLNRDFVSARLDDFVAVLPQLG